MSNHRTIAGGTAFTITPVGVHRSTRQRELRRREAYGVDISSTLMVETVKVKACFPDHTGRRRKKVQFYNSTVTRVWTRALRKGGVLRGKATGLKISLGRASVIAVYGRWETRTIVVDVWPSGL
ncbi:hypothetical protein E4U31_003795 [Claviceps sp. LM219 group G6]|nr:hypothetical protein E4U31_003795 [Claviceps sp. LM219 group G6]KAG6116962.1 hypothetical protein E4U14_008226 [Claviceps sp. LM454 group G7]